MKYHSALLFIILLIAFASCGKQNSDSIRAAEMSKADVLKSDSVQNVINENKLKKLVTIKNPNTMELETTPRDAATVAREKKMVVDCSDQFLEYAIKNGLDFALEEVNKARDGVFKNYIPDTQFYLTIIQKKEGTWTMIAHGTSRDFIGVEVIPDQWVDLSGWKFIEPIIQAGETKETNQLWIDKFYWQDPVWADGKMIRIAAYNRFYRIDNEDYWLHDTVFLDK